MPHKRSVLIGTAFIGLLVALACGRNALQEAADRQAAEGVQAPIFEVDPFWPKPLPNHWLLGSAIGVSVDEQDHVWIIHRSSATLDNNERGLELKPADRGVLRRRAAGPRVRSGGQPRRTLGRPGRRLRVADVEPRHHHRPQGQRLDWRQRSGRRARAEVHPGRQVPAAGGQCRRASRSRRRPGPAHVRRRQQRHRPASAASPRSSSTRAANEAYISDGYLNKRVAVIDADTGKLKRYWGAYGNRPDDTNLGPYDPDAPPAQQFRNPVHCAELSDDGLRLRLRSGQRPDPGVPQGRQVREGGVHRQAEPRRRVGVGHRLLEGPAADGIIYLADGRNMQRAHPAARHARGADQLRRRRPAAGPVLRRRTASPPTRRATSTRRKPTRASGCRSSSTRGSGRWPEPRRVRPGRTERVTEWGAAQGSRSRVSDP